MQYVVRGEDGQEYGPVDFQTLKDWAANNRVAPHSQVTDVLSQQTMPASAVPGLFTSGYARPTPVDAPPQSISPTTLQQFQQELNTREAKSAFTWAFIDGTLAILSFAAGGLGFIFGAFGIFNAFKAKQLGHKNANIAIIYAVTSGVILAGLYVLKLG